MSTENDTAEGQPPDRTAVALPLTRFMRAAWMSGFSSGLVTGLSGTRLPDRECDTIADSAMKKMDADPAIMAQVTREVDELVVELLAQDGTVSTVTSEGPQAGSEEAEMLSEAVRMAQSLAVLLGDDDDEFAGGAK